MLDQFKEKMTAAVTHLKEELKALRTSQANPHMLDEVIVEVFGSPLKLKKVATVNAPEPRQLLVAPFDPKNAPIIAKAIEKANLGFMPAVDGAYIRINIPPMDENMRKKIVAVCHQKREAAKVSVRNLRRDANDLFRKQKAASKMGEDELKKNENEIQKYTDKFCKEIDEASEKKEAEIMKI